MGNHSRFGSPAGYRDSQDFHGCRSATGNLETDLEVGDRVRVYRGRRTSDGEVGWVRQIVCRRVLVAQGGTERWFARSFVVFEPTLATIAKRKDAIRSQWTRFEGGLRSKYNEHRPYELPVVTPLY